MQKFLKSNLSDYNDAYVLVRSNITLIGHQVTHVAFKNCIPFTSCITKINGKTIDDFEYLDLGMPLFSLIEYSSNYSEKTGSLCFYSNDEATDFNANIAKTHNFKSFVELDHTNGILKKCNNCCASKLFKQFSEITRNVIN